MFPERGISEGATTWEQYRRENDLQFTYDGVKQLASWNLFFLVYYIVIIAGVLPEASSASRTVGPLWNAICSGSEKSHCLFYCSYLQQLPDLTSVMAGLLSYVVSKPRSLENCMAV